MTENLNPGFASQMIKIMSYNVWFREDVEVRARMKAIGQLIQEHSPDIIFFQVQTSSEKYYATHTPAVYSIKKSLLKLWNWHVFISRRSHLISTNFFKIQIGGGHIDVRFRQKK